MTIESPGNSVKDVVFLGQNVTNAEYVEGLVFTADFINENILHAKNVVDRENNVAILIGSSKKFHSVEEVEDEINSSNNPEAITVRDFVADGLLLAMRDGGDPKYTNALMTGQVDEIESVLPAELKVWAREVRNRFIDNTDITAILDQVNIDEYSLPGERIQLLQTAGRALNALKSVPKEQLELAKRAIRAMFVNETNVGEQSNKKEQVGNMTAQDEYLRDMAAYERSKGELERNVREVSLEELQEAYLGIMAPRERAPQMWEYAVPDFMMGMSRKDWRSLLTFQDGWLQAIYSKRGDVNYNNIIDKMSQGILSVRGLAEEDLKKWYEDRVINLRGVMHQIVKELLVPVEVGSINDGGVVERRKVYMFETEIDSKGKQQYVKGSFVEDFVNNEFAYKLALAQRLVDNKVVVNISVAKLSVALAMDMMEMGGVFSEADTLRKLGWESDVVRLSQRPSTKFVSKVAGGELFAGPWTEYANSLTDNNPTESVKLLQSLGVVPELLAGSFLDQKLYLSNGKQTSRTMMEMIYDDEAIPFRDLSNDLYFGWRKDHIQPAARMWMYISNKNPLEFSKNRESDSVISEWRADLYNDIHTLEKNGEAILPVSLIAAAIGGSVGIYPFEGPYLRISSGSHGNPVINNFESVTEIVRQLGISTEKSDRILKFFGVNNRNYRDFNTKIVSLVESRNVTLPKFYRDRSIQALRKKRPV